MNDGAELLASVAHADMQTDAAGCVRERLNTRDDVLRTLPGVTSIPDHQARAWTFLKVAEEGTSVAYALLSLDPDDPEDYLMAGWWAQFPDQRPPELSFERSEQYAIVDGPEIDHSVPPRLPAEGTASYAGPAGGLYTYLAGSDWGEDEGAYVVDEYEGTVTITADFTDGTLRGCIGCVGDLVTRRAHFGVFLGEESRDARTVAADYDLRLGTVIFGEDGTFERDRVTVRHPERTIAHSEGSRGGAMSSRPDADGKPPLVTGFSSASFEESDGSKGRLVGSFPGLSGPFSQTGESRPPPGDGD